MNPALWISKTGLSAQDARLTSISNNLANVNTTAFKKDRTLFADLFLSKSSARRAVHRISKIIHLLVPSMGLGSKLSARRKNSVSVISKIRDRN